MKRMPVATVLVASPAAWAGRGENKTPQTINSPGDPTNSNDISASAIEYTHTPRDVITNHSMPYCAEVAKGEAALLVYSTAIPAPDFEVVVKGEGAGLFACWRANEEAGLAAYHVCLGRSPGQYDTVSTTRDTQTILENLAEGREYSAGVTAMDQDGRSCTAFAPTIACD